PAPLDARSNAIEDAGLTPAMMGLRFDPDASWWGRGGARIDAVRLLDADARPIRAIDTGREVVIEVTCHTDEPLVYPVLGYVVRDRAGRVLFSDNSWLIFGAEGPGPIQSGTAFVTRFRVHFPYLPAGEYAVGAAIADGRPGDFIQQHRVDDALIFRVPTSHLVEGIVGVPMLGCEIQAIERSPENQAQPTVDEATR
ncbi:MAG: Wzt carbohydrate-binding domain-containing protein, partial [Planctomycetota bacterium]